MKILVPLFLKDEYADKDLQEEAIRESGLDRAVVRPMIPANGPWMGRYRAGVDLKPGLRPWISRADVAEFLLRQLHGDAFLRQTPAVGR